MDQVRVRVWVRVTDLRNRSPALEKTMPNQRNHSDKD